MGVLELLIGVVFVLLVGLGAGVAAISDATSGEYSFARACFFVAAAALGLAYFYWVTTAERPYPARMILGLIAGALVFVGLPESIRWVDGREARTQAKPETPQHAAQPATSTASVAAEMPSLLSLFMSEFEGKGSGGGLNLYLHGYMDVTFADRPDQVRLHYTIAQDYGNRAKFLIIYIPATTQTKGICEYIAANLSEFFKIPFETETGSPGAPSVTRGGELVFTGRVFIYYETTLSVPELGRLTEVFEAQHLSPEFRSTAYALAVWQSIRSGDAKPFPKFEIRNGLPVKLGDDGQPAPSKFPHGTITLPRPTPPPATPAATPAAPAPTGPSENQRRMSVLRDILTDYERSHDGIPPLLRDELVKAEDFINRELKSRGETWRLTKKTKSELKLPQ